MLTRFMTRALWRESVQRAFEGCALQRQRLPRRTRRRSSEPNQTPHPASERLEERCLLANTSAPVTLQLFDSSYANLEDRAADIFMAGYGAVWMPPPGRADLSNFSVGYDVYDRFDLGSPGNATLYGTETGMKTAVDLIHRLGGNYIVDYIANHAGFSDLGTSGFAAAGGYPGLAITLPGDIDGDFHSSFDSGDLNGRLAGLVDIAQEKNHQLIRNPVDAGATNNIPAGTTPAFGRLANVPDPNNARFYPDQSQTPIMLFDPVTNESNIPVYPFNNANPLAGDAIAENATGYLMRNAQWLVQTMGVDGFRIDAAKHINGFFFDFFDRAVYRSSNRYQLDGSQQQIYSFSEVFDGSKSYQQSFIKKTINTNDPGRIGGNRDVLDFPLFFALRDNFTGNGFTNDFRNVVGASQDSQDDGFANNGSQGFSFVNSHDENGPYLSNVAHAFTLLRPGSSVVYMNAEEFGTNRDFPKDGRGDALGGTFGNTLTTLVDLRNTHGRGNYIERYLEKELLVFEREDSMLALLSNRTDGGYDQRTVSTSFAPGTPLIELTGNASDSAFDPFNDFPEMIVVNGDGTANVRVPRNTSPDGTTAHNRGYLVYGLATPQGTLSLSNVASTIAAETADASTNGTARLTSIDVITGNSFDLTLTTVPVNLLGFQRDQPADGDEALFKIDEGYDLNGSGLVDYRTPGGVSYGFEQFTGTHSPGYLDAEGDGLYQQTISTTGLSEGTHFVTVRAFRHREPGEGEAVYKDFRKVIYVDRLPANSTVSSFSPIVSGVNENRRATIRSVDKTANNVHVLLDVGAAKTDAEVIAMLGAGTQASQVDRDVFTRDMSGLTSGNHALTVVSYEQSGRVSVQRFAGQAVSSVFGTGLGDLDADGDVDATDIGLFETVLLSNNQQFNAAADLNADGLVNNSDVILLQARLGEVSANSETLGAYNALFGVAPGGYSSNKGITAHLTFTRPALDQPQISFAWDLNDDGNFNDVTGQNPAVNWSTLTTLGISTNGTYPIAVRASDSINTAVFETSLTITGMSPEEWQALADQHSANNQLADAIYAQNMVVGLVPDGAVGWIKLRDLYIRDGQIPQATYAAILAAQLDPTAANYTELARLYIVEAGNLTDGVPALQEAIELGGARHPEWFTAAGFQDVVDYLISLQLPNGALRFSTQPSAYIDNQSAYRIDPYFADLAITGLLLSPATQEEKLTVADAYITWRLAQTEADGRILRPYYFVDGSYAGRTDPADADDSAAATFLTLLEAYHQAGGTALQLPGVRAKIDAIVGVMVALQQPDGLTFVSNSFPVKYLADNSEVFRGYQSAAYLYREVFLASTAASDSAARAESVRSGILSNLFDAETGYFHISLQDGVPATPADFDHWYDEVGHSSLIVWPALFGVIAEESSVAVEQLAGLTQHFAWETRTDWATIGYAALISGDLTNAREHLDTLLQGPFPTPFGVPDDALSTIGDVGFILRMFAPAAHDDTGTVAPSHEITLNVKANDYDLQSMSSALTVGIVSAPLYGTAAVLPDGRIRYTRGTDDETTDSFRYSIANELGGIDFAAITIIPDQAPTISGIDNQTVAEEQATDSLSFTVGDVETAAADLTVSGSSSNTSLVPSDNIVITGSGSSRSVVVTPAANQVGSATITLTVNDGARTGTTSFVLTVTGINDAPTISAIDDLATDEDTATSSIAFTVGDLETTAADLTVNGSSSDTTLVPNGNIVVSGSGSSRSVVVTPAANQFGSATITLTVSDGDSTATESFLLTVNAINDAPTISAIDDQTVAQNIASNALSFTLSDAETAAADLTVTGSSSNTTLVPNGNIVISGSGASRSVVVTPASDQSGTATITLTVSDGALTSTETFTLTVNGTPTISAIDDQTIDEDAATDALPFTVSDPESSASLLTVSGSSSNTTLVPNGNIVVSGSGSSRVVVVTPAANQFGSATITLTVSDGTTAASESFTLLVSAENDAPTISAIDDQTVVHGTASDSLSFTIDDIETAAADLTVTGTSSNEALVSNSNIVISGSGASRSVVVTPAANQSGSATITLTVSDGELSSTETFLVTIDGPPTISAIDDQSINEDSATGSLSFTVGDDLTAAADLTVSGSSSNTTLIPNASIMLSGSGANRSVIVTPVANQFGSATITLTVSDGSSTSTETFTLTVNAVNDAPTISTISDQTTAEDTATNAINFTIGDLETATDALEIERGSSNTTLVPIDNIAISGSGANRNLVVTPAANQSGTATITISVSDGSGTTSESFVLTVDAVNDAPTISTVDDQSINEDGATGSLSFTIGDVDTAAAELTVTGTSSNTTLIPNANIVVSGNGVNRSVVVTPAAHQHGSATITLTVNDGTGTATETFDMTIAGIPDGISVTDSIAVINTQTMNGLVVTRHPLDGDEITFVKVTDITGGNLFRNNGTTPINNGDFVSYSDANAGLRFTPTTSGSGHFTVQAATAANDAALGGTTATATIQTRAPLSFAVTPDGVASTFGLRRNGSNIEVVNVSNAVVASRAAALTTQVQLTGADGEADLLIVEFSGGDPRAEGLSFNAGTGSGDALRFAGSLNASDLHVTGTSIGAGTVTLTAGNANTTFSGIEELSVVVTSLATATINIADGLNHTTDLVDAGAGQASIAMPGLFNVITIKPTTALTINGDDVAADVLRVLSVPTSFAASLTVNGRGGNDTLTAASFAKAVAFDGGLGNDTLIGGSGADSLAGGDGDDELTGGRGVDVLDGGNGTADRLREQDDVNFVLTSSLTRSGVGFTTETELLAGFETATLIGGVSSNSINASGWTGMLGVILDAGGNGTDTLLGSPKNDSLTGGSGRDSIVGSDGDDTLAGGSGNDTLVGGNGRDSILASAGADSALGGAGLDTIFGGTGNDTLDGGEGNDIVNGQDNDDSLLGSAGVDKVAGGTGNDTLDGGTEADTVNGESGDDSLRGNDGDDLVTGGDGVDRLDGGNGNDRLRGEAGNDTLLGGGGADNLFGGANDDSVDGGADNDSLFGDFGNDIVLGGDGDDQLRGFEGNDVLDGGGGSDRISEEADTNFVIIGLQLSSPFTGTETVLNIERFNLNGGSSHNLIDARRSSVKVILNGLDGNDTLLGSPFVDNIFGGNGDDIVSGGASNDVLDGGAGTDFLYEVANADFTLTATQLVSAATGTETPTGIERAALVGGTGNNRFDATTAAIPVILLGGSGNDTLIGGAFNDVLVGGSRADTTAGTDALTGNAGADTLDASNGDTRTIDAFDTVLADVLASIPSWIDAI